MAIRSRKSGSWSIPDPGKIKVRKDGEWKTALSVKVKKNGEWKDSLYVAYPNAATNFSASPGTGGGNNTFSWVKPTTGAPATGYKLYVYSDQACTTQVDTKTVSGGDTLSTTYTRGSAGTNGADGTTYYVRLKTLGAGSLESQGWATSTSGSSTIIKVVNGSATYTPPSAWSWATFTNTIPLGYPFGGTASSWSGQGYDNSYNPGNAFDNNSSTYWRSQWWDYNYAWEWISFSIASSSYHTDKIKVTAVYFTPYGNGPGTYYLDLLALDGSWLYVAGPGASNTISCSAEIPSGGSATYRLNFSSLGSNPGVSTYNAQIAEIRFDYKTWITFSPVPAAANKITYV